jgi:hypothetical protein
MQSLSKEAFSFSLSQQSIKVSSVKENSMMHHQIFFPNDRIPKLQIAVSSLNFTLKSWK